MTKPRPVVFAVLSIAIGFLLALTLLVTAELSYRLLSGRAPRPALHAAAAPGPTVHSVYDTQYAELDPEVGAWPKPGSRTRMVRPRQDGSLGVDVVYSVDSERRRITPGSSSDPKKPSLFFLGCSYTYGDDLQDGETLPAAAASLQSHFRVYNYSFHAWGPGNLLRLVHLPSFARDVPKIAGGKAIYLYMRDHPNRVLGTLGIYRTNTGWETRLPYYFLNGNGELETRGMISDRPLRDPLFHLLSRSVLLEALGVDFPPRHGGSDFKLFASILKDLEVTLKEKMNGMELVTVFFPGSDESGLIPFLKKSNLPYLDYSRLDARKFVTGPLTGLDGIHPSAGMNRFLAERILTDLNIRLRPALILGPAR